MLHRRNHIQINSLWCCSRCRIKRWSSASTPKRANQLGIQASFNTGVGETIPGMAASFKTGVGETIPGIAASFNTGVGETIPGMAASFNTGVGETIPGIAASFNTGVGETIPGMAASFNTGVGETIPGIAEFATRCVVGAAVALTADRARAEPRATHETFNHERIWIFLNWKERKPARRLT